MRRVHTVAGLALLGGLALEGCGTFGSDDSVAPPVESGPGDAPALEGGSVVDGPADALDARGPDAGTRCTLGGTTLVCADFESPALIQGGFASLVNQPNVLVIEPWPVMPSANRGLRVKAPTLTAGETTSGYLEKVLASAPAKLLRFGATVRRGTNAPGFLELVTFRADNLDLRLSYRNSIPTGSVLRVLTKDVGSGTETILQSVPLPLGDAVPDLRIDIEIQFGTSNTIAIHVDGSRGGPGALTALPNGLLTGRAALSVGAYSVEGPSGGGSFWIDDVVLEAD